MGAAIDAIKWPTGTGLFLINPDKGRGRGQGNGVKPIKEACMVTLEQFGWSTNERQNPLRFDAVKQLPHDVRFALEWETGNISSSHRAVNRILLGHLDGLVAGGILVLPTRSLYRFLTDRVGNRDELLPYYPLWQAQRWDDGLFAIFAVEHDGTSTSSPRIEKGTDGRALI